MQNPFPTGFPFNNGMGNFQQPTAQPGGSNQPPDSPLMLQLKKQLAEAEALQARMYGALNQNSGLFPPNPGPPPEHQQFSPQQLIQNLPPEAQMILRMYDEFSHTDDGKELATALNKFNGYCQAKLNTPAEENKG